MIKVLPGDSREDVAKRVAMTAVSLMEELAKSDPVSVYAVELFRSQWRAQGVKWLDVSDQPLDLDEWLPAADIAELAEVGVATVRQWRKRGHITSRWDSHRQLTVYNVGEVLAYQRRQRQARARTRTRC